MKNSDLADLNTPDSGRLAILEFYRAAQVNGALTPAKVCDLGRKLTADRSISRDEADALFMVDAAPVTKCAEWTEFLVEAMTDHVVWQSRPTGVLSSAQGEWLLAKADASMSISALAVLVHILAEADRVPAWFIAAVRGRVARGWPGVEEAIAAANMARAA